MRRIKPGSPGECPTEHTLKVIGGSWKLPLVYFLFQGTKRYSEVQRRLHGISPRMLSKQLRELERDGIIQRKVYPEVPPKVEYSLTPSGRSLSPIVEALFKWGERHMVPGPTETAKAARP
jgi:DNA-binding HxlR family transcriptional regulator